MNVNDNSKYNIIILSYLTFFGSVLILFFIKLYTLFKSYDLYVTSGAEIATLNFIQNFLNGNNLATSGNSNILYEFYGLNFHIIYWPLIKFCQFFGLSYLLSTRLISLGLTFLLTFVLILIAKNISKKNFIFKDNLILFYFLILSFLINNQASSWWILTYRPDILTILFSFIGIYFFFLFIDKNKNSSLFLSVIFCVLSWTFKQNFLYAIVSIFSYLLIKKKYYHFFFSFFLVVLVLFLLNILTGYNNLDLLNRSPDVVISHLEFKNYFEILIKYLAKNPYLLIFVFIVFFCTNEIKNNKKLFLYLVFLFLFLQSSLMAVLHGAGYNHLMAFLFFAVISICLIDYNFIKRYYIIISLFLIISSCLNYFQLFNYNKFGRQGLYFNVQEKKELKEFKIFIQNEIEKPALLIGGANRTEMFLSEDLMGKDTFQLVSFIDDLWSQWLFRSKYQTKKNKKIFHDKFKDVKTVLVLDKDKKKIRYFDNFLKQNNFRLSSEYNLSVYETTNLDKFKMIINYETNIDLIKKNFFIYKKVTF